MRLIPEGQEDTLNSLTGSPLEINKAKAKELLDKARELLTKPMEASELSDALEQHYVESNEHYTSAQLIGVVKKLYAELNPEPEVVEPVEEPIEEIVTTE